jgi:hypothetical protein
MLSSEPLPPEPDTLLIAEPDIGDLPDPLECGQAAAEANDYDLRAETEHIKRLRAKNKQRKQDRKERRKYAHRIFCLISSWLTCVLLMTMMDGFAWNGFHLDRAVLITTIGTTTGSVLGVFLIVTNYLFPKSKK